SNGILVVAGTLIAGGAAGNPVTFTSNLGSPTPGSWRNLSFLSTASSMSYVDNCVFEFGGSGTNGATIFYFTGAPPINISNTVVRLSGGHGINVRASSPRISTSDVRDNAGYGIYSDLVTTMKVDSSIVAENTLGGIRIPINSNPEVTNTRIDSNGIGVFIDNSSAPKIQNNLIRYNSTGIQFTALGTTQPIIEKNTITNNATWGFLNSGTGIVIARNNYWGSDFGPFHASLNPTGLGDNVSNNVDFQPWTILAAAKPVAVKTATQITSNTTWYADSVYWIKPSSGNVLQVNSGITLTVNPGVIVKFQTSARLYVLGTIVANGKMDSLIVFTSDRDDPYGGDTNEDSTLTIPSRGIWDMVWLNAGGNSSSVLNNCVVRFGGSSGNGNLRVDNSTPTISNISSTQSSYYGMYLNNNANVTVSYSTFGSSTYDGVLIYSSNPYFYGSKFKDNGRYGILANSGSPHFTVRKSEFTGNSHGIVADAGSSGATLVSLDSSNVSNNVNGGLYLWYGTGPQTFSHNRISNNGAYGLWCYNVDNTVIIEGDTITNNGQEGIITSKAVISNNVIQGNRYPIALIGRVSTTYSGNSISGNQFNNAIALRMNRENLSDTLRTVFPAGMTSGTYVLTENSTGVGVAAGETLFIEPGVIMKMDPSIYFRVDGTLIANGTVELPIVFTSYRDASYGGKTNLASDNAAPAPGDWRYVRIRTAGANASVLNNVVFKYGGTDGVGNLWLESTITLSTPIRNVISRKSSSMGIRVGDGQMVFENCTIDSNATYGMYIEGNRPSDVTLRTSTIQDNANGQGLRAVNNSAFREISNCIIRRNSSWGVGVDNGTINQTYTGNTVSFNGAGIYNNSPNIPATGLSFIGNIVTDHTGDGILSSRAQFIDNNIQRNRFPLAVWRKLGNIYTDNSGDDGNVISGNVYNNAIALWQGALSDTLKATFPQAITSKTYVAIYDIQVDASTTL
ncbi:MAG: right-handed parallel beta-helix repeat-containing protein, partial [Ignavibacteriales bacterium]|nr:right-handed parallel beta-helix repeat-containing protein [Ignavibacteriales bacterium]